MKHNSAMNPEFRFLPILAFLALAACAPSKKEPEKEDPPKESRSKLVGRIASIPVGHRFVLIQRYGKLPFEPGSILTTRGENHRTSNLLVTGEALGSFAAADIQSGEIEVGDLVYSHQFSLSEPQNKPEEKSEVTDIKNLTEIQPPN